MATGSASSLSHSLARRNFTLSGMSNELVSQLIMAAMAAQGPGPAGPGPALARDSVETRKGQAVFKTSADARVRARAHAHMFARAYTSMHGRVAFHCDAHGNGGGGAPRLAGPARCAAQAEKLRAAACRAVVEGGGGDGG